jgi:hypothetical protein
MLRRLLTSTALLALVCLTGLVAADRAAAGWHWDRPPWYTGSWQSDGESGYSGPISGSDSYSAPTYSATPTYSYTTPTYYYSTQVYSPPTYVSTPTYTYTTPTYYYRPNPTYTTYTYSTPTYYYSR